MIKLNINIKKIVLYLVGICLISYGIAMALSFGHGNLLKVSDKDYKVNESKELSTNSISRIYVDSSAADVYVSKGSKVNVTAQALGNVSSTSNNIPKLDCYKDGDTLYINFKRKGPSIHIFDFTNKSDVKLNITIPEAYKNNLEVYSSAGDTSIKDLSLNSMYAKLSAGSMDLENLNIAEKLTLNNSAGGIDGKSIVCKTSAIDASAGNIKLEDFSGDIQGRNSAGNTSISYSKFNNNVDFRSSAGNIKLTIPKDSKFKLDAYASAGDVDCDFPLSSTGSGAEKEVKGSVGESNNIIQLKNSAGNIDINN